jgi:hypothetical protein
MSKSTLISIHVMPHEFPMFQRWIESYSRSLTHLKKPNDVILKATLNLNPALIDWPGSSLQPRYFVDKFHALLSTIPHIHDVIEDNSCRGVTDQRRSSIGLAYDQHIFADADLAFPEVLLMHLLDKSETLNGRYLVTPSLVRMWDPSWDPLVHQQFKNKPIGYCKLHAPGETTSQVVSLVSLRAIDTIKYSGGWFTLYSKEFFEFTGIPLALGGYGAEDEFGGFAALVARENGFEVTQYVLDGIYISENYVSRDTEKVAGIRPFDFDKVEARRQLVPAIEDELRKFSIRSLGKEIFCKIQSYKL